jgi:hypothetical protein
VSVKLINTARPPFPVLDHFCALRIPPEGLRAHKDPYPSFAAVLCFEGKCQRCEREDKMTVQSKSLLERAGQRCYERAVVQGKQNAVRKC